MKTFVNTVKLLRFPFSFLLLPVFLFTLSQQTAINIKNTFIAFFIIHLLVYPSSNGYNGYIDADTESVGGLKNPPQPTKQLFYVTVIMDVFAVILSAVFLTHWFAFCISIYILASKAYSSKIIRLKKYPIAGFLTVVFFQGGFTYYMCAAALTGNHFVFDRGGIYVLLACSLQIAGAYPLTQIYQHKQDSDAGVKTLSYKLGYRGTFVFTMLMFLMANFLYFLYFDSVSKPQNFFLLQLFFMPIVAYFIYWLVLVFKNPAKANFKYTMAMNWIAAVSMNMCFIVMFLTNNKS